MRVVQIFAEDVTVPKYAEVGPGAVWFLGKLSFDGRLSGRGRVGVVHAVKRPIFVARVAWIDVGGDAAAVVSDRGGIVRVQDLAGGGIVVVFGDECRVVLLDSVAFEARPIRIEIADLESIAVSDRRSQSVFERAGRAVNHLGGVGDVVDAVAIDIDDANLMAVVAGAAGRNVFPLLGDGSAVEVVGNEHLV